MVEFVCKLFRKIKFATINLFLSYEQQAVKAGVKVGKGTVIYSRFWSLEPYLITIGENCQLTQDCKIFTHGGGNVLRSLYPTFDCFGKVKLGNNVYVGANSLIMPGVEIGNNVLIGAGSVVTKSVPSNVVIAGNPAKIVSTIDEFARNSIKYNLSSKGLSYNDKKKFLLSLPDDKFIFKDYLSKK